VSLEAWDDARIVTCTFFPETFTVISQAYRGDEVVAGADNDAVVVLDNLAIRTWSHSNA